MGLRGFLPAGNGGTPGTVPVGSAARHGRSCAGRTQRGRTGPVAGLVPTHWDLNHPPTHAHDKLPLTSTRKLRQDTRRSLRNAPRTQSEIRKNSEPIASAPRSMGLFSRICFRPRGLYAISRRFEEDLTHAAEPLDPIRVHEVACVLRCAVGCRGAFAICQIGRAHV